MRTPALVLVSIAGIAALAIACGGGDDEDFSDIVDSATAASSRSPSAGSSDPASPSPAASKSASATASATESASASATAENTATPVPTASATEATATATAEVTSTASNGGGDNTASYTANVRAGADELKANVATLKNEMFASQANQTEAAGVELKRQIALVNGNIATLRSYAAPASLSGFAADLEVALKKLESGTRALTRAVDNKDQLAGLEAFTAFNEGESLLDSAMSDLP